MFFIIFIWSSLLSEWLTTSNYLKICKIHVANISPYACITLP